MDRVTKHDIEYRPAPYGCVATIPAGTRVVPANNLPNPGQYWAEPWANMSDRAESWQRNYGFLIEKSETVER